MSNEIESTGDKKMFDRWKENLKEFFLEDDKKEGVKKTEENENLIDSNGNTSHTEPVDNVLEKAEEKLIDSLSPVLTNGKEDLAGIPEVEEEDISEDSPEQAKSNGNGTVVVDQNQSDPDTENGIDVDSNEETLLIQETVEEQANESQSKTPFFKILAKFPFLKKKASEDPAAVQQTPPVDSENKVDSNGLPSYSEAVNQHDENPETSDETDKKDGPKEEKDISNDNMEQEINVEKKDNKEDAEVKPADESLEHDKDETNTNGTVNEEGSVTNGDTETQDIQDIKEAAEETKKVDKKSRFRFQFFTDKK